MGRYSPSSAASGGDVTAASAFATDNVLVRSDGTGKGVQPTGITVADTSDNMSGVGAIIPKTNDGGALGDVTHNWSDLFLASGAVVNYANGNFTITHASGVLTMSGALSLGVSNPMTVGTLEIGHATDTTLSRSSAGIAAIEGSAIKTAGRETIFIPAAAMTARTTNGPSAGAVEMTTNKNMFVTKDFDTTTQEFCQFEVFFPKSWDLSTVKFQAIWSHPSTTTNFGVVFALQGVARSDGDAGDVAFGTEQTVTDTGGTTNTIYLSNESAAITIGGSPQLGDSVLFQIKRNPADGSDTMAVDARLHGIRLFFNSYLPTDT